MEKTVSGEEKITMKSKIKAVLHQYSSVMEDNEIPCICLDEYNFNEVSDQIIRHMQSPSPDTDKKGIRWVKCGSETNPTEVGWYLLRSPDSFPMAIGRSWFSGKEWRWSYVAKNYLCNNVAIEWLDESAEPETDFEKFAKESIAENERIHEMIENVDTYKKGMDQSVIRRAIHALEYCAFNYDETTDVDVPDTLVESTGVSDTAILAARELKKLLPTVSQPSTDPTYSALIAQLKKAEQEIYRLRNDLNYFK